MARMIRKDQVGKFKEQVMNIVRMADLARREPRKEEMDRELIDLTADFWRQVYAAQADLPKADNTKGDACARSWPVLSESLGTMPDQIPEAKEDLKRSGIPTEFTPGGRAIITSENHMRAIMKLRKLHRRSRTFRLG